MSSVPLSKIQDDAPLAAASASIFTKPVEDKYVGARHSIKQIKLFLSRATSKAERKAIVSLAGVGKRTHRKH